MEKNLRILAVYSGSVVRNSGTPIRIRNILLGLSKLPGVELDVASYDVALNFPDRHVRLSKAQLKAIVSMIFYVKRNKIKVFIGHTHSAKFLIIALRLFTSAKVVWEMHGFSEEQKILYGSLSKVRYWILKCLYAVAYMFAHKITTCSDTATKEISKYNGNAVTVVGGVDLTTFNNEIKPADFFTARKQEGKIIIGYAGNAMPWQGLDFLVNSLENIQFINNDFHLALLLSGDHTYQNTSNISVFNPLPHDEVVKFTAACDILVIPRPKTRHNDLAFPSKLLEYMATEKAVIASDTSDVSMIIKSGVNGLIYIPDDIESFKSCLIKLKDKELRKEMGRKAFQTAKQFSWENQNNLFANTILS
jgi:glycosyltransferase involved in cell wall biosynthesis